MVSYYHYASIIDPAIKQAGLTAFLHMQDPLGVRPASRNLDNVEYWHHHVSSWLARRGVFFISFKAWIEDYEAQIVRLAEFLELNMPRTITNVVRRSRNERGDTKLWNRAWEKAYKLLNRYVTGRDFTTVNFRVGKTNAYLTTFSDEDLSFFESKAGDLLTRLGYATSLRVG